MRQAMQVHAVTSPRSHQPTAWLVQSTCVLRMDMRMWCCTLSAGHTKHQCLLIGAAALSACPITCTCKQVARASLRKHKLLPDSSLFAASMPVHTSIELHRQQQQGQKPLQQGKQALATGQHKTLCVFRGAPCIFSELTQVTQQTVS